jgi:hypothetical protein
LVDKIQQDFPRTPSPIYQKLTREDGSSSAPLPTPQRVLQPQPQQGRSQILAANERHVAQTQQQRQSHLSGIAQPQPQQLSPMYYPESTASDLSASFGNLTLESQVSLVNIQKI